MSWLLWVTKAVLHLHHQHKVVLQIAKWITYFFLQDPNQKMNQTRCLFVGLLTRMIHHHTLQYLLSFSQLFTCLFKLQMVLENLHFILSAYFIVRNFCGEKFGRNWSSIFLSLCEGFKRERKNTKISFYIYV